MLWYDRCTPCVCISPRPKPRQSLNIMYALSIEHAPFINNYHICSMCPIKMCAIFRASFREKQLLLSNYCLCQQNNLWARLLVIYFMSKSWICAVLVDCQEWGNGIFFHWIQWKYSNAFHWIPGSDQLNHQNADFVEIFRYNFGSISISPFLSLTRHIEQ